jgi:hypothetical protein
MSHLLCSASLISIAWSQSQQESHAVVGRVQIPAVTQVLKLAEPNPIFIPVVGERVTSVVASWTYYVGNIPHPAAEEDSVLQVSYDSNGVASVSVTPLKAPDFISPIGGDLEHTATPNLPAYISSLISVLSTWSDADVLHSPDVNNKIQEALKR